jgi:RNA polymerase sigma-70 factor (ECF subfamily)
MQTRNVPRLAELVEPQVRRSAAAGRPCRKQPAPAVPPAFFKVSASVVAPASSVWGTGMDERPATSNRVISKEALFRQLMADYGASLYYFVLKRVGHPDDAADIAQQTFVEAACSYTTYRGQAELSTWIFGIATNLARNHISRAPQHRHRFESDDVLDACESADLQPCESLSQRQGLELVTEAMRQMPTEMARALSLIAVEELSYEEAAIELDVPVGTVRSRVSRARAAARAHLRSNGYIGAEI